MQGGRTPFSQRKQAKITHYVITKAIVQQKIPKHIQTLGEFKGSDASGFQWTTQLGGFTCDCSRSYMAILDVLLRNAGWRQIVTTATLKKCGLHSCT